MKKWFKRLFCFHHYVKAEKPWETTNYKFRVCTKCGNSQAGGYAIMDGRFYWVKFDTQLKALEEE